MREFISKTMLVMHIPNLTLMEKFQGKSYKKSYLQFPTSYVKNAEMRALIRDRNCTVCPKIHVKGYIRLIIMMKIPQHNNHDVGWSCRNALVQ